MNAGGLSEGTRLEFSLLVTSSVAPSGLLLGRCELIRIGSFTRGEKLAVVLVRRCAAFICG
ncbi:hypothetical protein RBSWK_01044 [Rhodopirellula baltica SWK14]|uniref:Uncharacterized protein n=1 Tax=Rhodopirellula baltica SWK14 TaxID=993516 RepID=L7CLA1_RHOBT|nr:hypothetical protein RBSWK_01044 [Rhodopirellula baltica SWK14]